MRARRDFRPSTVSRICCVDFGGGAGLENLGPPAGARHLSPTSDPTATAEGARSPPRLSFDRQACGIIPAASVPCGGSPRFDRYRAPTHPHAPSTIVHQSMRIRWLGRWIVACARDTPTPHPPIVHVCCVAFVRLLPPCHAAGLGARVRAIRQPRAPSRHTLTLCIPFQRQAGDSSGAADGSTAR